MYSVSQQDAEKMLAEHAATLDAVVSVDEAVTFCIKSSFVLRLYSFGGSHVVDPDSVVFVHESSRLSEKEALDGRRVALVRIGMQSRGMTGVVDSVTLKPGGRVCIKTAWQEDDDTPELTLELHYIFAACEDTAGNAPTTAAALASFAHSPEARLGKT